MSNKDILNTIKTINIDCKINLKEMLDGFRLHLFPTLLSNSRRSNGGQSFELPVTTISNNNGKGNHNYE